MLKLLKRCQISNNDTEKKARRHEKHLQEQAKMTKEDMKKAQNRCKETQN